MHRSPYLRTFVRCINETVVDGTNLPVDPILHA